MYNVDAQGGSEIFLRNVFENILKTYLRKNPTAKTIWELVQSVDNEKICYDHFTFRTLKVRTNNTLQNLLKLVVIIVFLWGCN